MKVSSFSVGRCNAAREAGEARLSNSVEPLVIVRGRACQVAAECEDRSAELQAGAQKNAYAIQ